eukprot:Skav204593  [mRNA]  locus=scaffold672:173093:183000:- [translate_table: standard]
MAPSGLGENWTERFGFHPYEGRAHSDRWQGTSLHWNRNVTIWNGSGEAEALSELFVDNLGSLLGTTTACVNQIGYDIVGRNAAFVANNYGLHVAQEWEKVFFTRNIPGCAFSLLLGNLYYAWQCGRLGNKENRTDVTAQPYGINTTGAFITLFAIQLEALFTGAFMFLPDTTATQQEVQQAAANAADYAWKVSVACNFLLGIFEPLGEGVGFGMLGAFFGESIRKVAPTAAFYAPMMGVGFVFLAFVPMLAIAKEPMMCLIPLLIVFNGFFGGVRYKIYKILGRNIRNCESVLQADCHEMPGGCTK